MDEVDILDYLFEIVIYIQMNSQDYIRYFMMPLKIISLAAKCSPKFTYLNGSFRNKNSIRYKINSDD